MATVEQNSSDHDRQLLARPRSEAMAWLLVGGGVAGALVMLIRGYQRVIDWVMPVGLIGLGLGFLLRQPQQPSDEVVARVRADLKPF
jgi:hypothetical protein